MKQLTVEDLRALIRLIPPARALHEELDRSIHLETFDGTGDLAVRSFQGLQQSVIAITEDPYVAALEIRAGEETPDKQLVSQVILAASQLIAYLEGQAGVAGLTRRGGYSIQTAPSVTLNMEGFQGDPYTTERVMETVDRVIKFKRPPEPPMPPTPPAPPEAPLHPYPPQAGHRGYPGARVEWEEDDQV
jgi:hypothetical protein